MSPKWALSSTADARGAAAGAGAAAWSGVGFSAGSAAGGVRGAASVAGVRSEAAGSVPTGRWDSAMTRPVGGTGVDVADGARGGFAAPPILRDGGLQNIVEGDHTHHPIMLVHDRDGD
jgi:hypothetical protein